MIIIDRIVQFVNNKGISIRQFEKKINASNGLISNAKRKKTDIQSKWLSEIINSYPELNANWLITGDGVMIKEEETLDIMNEPQASYNTKGKSINNLEIEISYLKKENQLLRDKIEDKERIILMLDSYKQ